ncbi:MAG TPA: sigma factor [Trebonia sp.]|nr:sigma factor [Trebonia sp.]
MTELARDEEFSAFVLARRPELLRSACLLTAGDWQGAEDLVQVALAKLYLAWPRVRRTGTQVACTWRIIVNTHVDEVRRPRWRREQSVTVPPDTPDAGALAASNKDPNVFIGKLVIFQESFDTSDAQGLSKTVVRGHAAYYRVEDGIASLIIEQSPGRWLDVQAPTSLGWTEQLQAQFGAGVTILPTAQEGQG